MERDVSMGFIELLWERKRLVIFPQKVMKKGYCSAVNPVSNVHKQTSWSGEWGWISRRRCGARLWIFSSLEI